MRELGPITLIQVQRSSLKVGEKPHRYYDPSPLLAVERAFLSSDGVIGMTSDDRTIIDVHNAQHIASKFRPHSAISIGFTSHYHEMRERFGAHLTDGCAGENLLIDTNQHISLDDLGATLVVQHSNGQQTKLGNIIVAAPCVEFSHFAASQTERLPAEVLKATLQFLDHGQRGFYAQLIEGAETTQVQVGDRVFIATN